MNAEMALPGAEPASPGAGRRIALVVGWLGVVALAVLVLHLVGVDVEDGSPRSGTP
jgi:hypothetical protein